ncbi:MAG: DsbA family protein [Rhodospirillales bacterium]|nr:DsbA family protein [Rhodospirillales bacterium]
MDKSIIFFGDPMCSWCWGFAPVMRSIAETYGDEIPLSMVVGGLRAGNTKVMDDQAKAEIRHHWEDVEKASGQPFDFSFFERNDFIYDTEPSCRAVVTMRNIMPEATFGYFALLHGAFYAANQDITQTDILVELAEKFDVDSTAFRDAFESPEIQKETFSDFMSAQQLGVTGFPTLVLRDGKQLRALNRGYCEFDVIKPALDQWVTETIELPEEG